MRSSGFARLACAARRHARDRAARSCSLRRKGETGKQGGEVLDDGAGELGAEDAVGEEEAQQVDAALRGDQTQPVAVQRAAESGEHRRRVALVAQELPVHRYCLRCGRARPSRVLNRFWVARFLLIRILA